jgi:hypothetical protein
MVRDLKPWLGLAESRQCGEAIFARRLRGAWSLRAQKVAMALLKGSFFNRRLLDRGFRCEAPATALSL